MASQTFETSYSRDENSITFSQIAGPNGGKCKQQEDRGAVVFVNGDDDISLFNSSPAAIAECCDSIFTQMQQQCEYRINSETSSSATPVRKQSGVTGSTLSLSFIQQNKNDLQHYRIVTAHAGDSPTYLIIKRGETVTAIRLTKSLHNPHTPSEAKRLQENHGYKNLIQLNNDDANYIDFSKGRMGDTNYNVVLNLAISRGMGYNGLKGFIATPDVHIYDIHLQEFADDAELYILQTSDGLTEKYADHALTDTDYVANLFKKAAAINNSEDEQEETIAKNLTSKMAEQAYDDGSTDNITMNLLSLKKSNNRFVNAAYAFIADGNNGFQAAESIAKKLPGIIDTTLPKQNFYEKELNNLPFHTAETITPAFIVKEKTKEKTSPYETKLKELSNKLLNNKWNIVNIFGVRGYRVHSEDIKNKKGLFWKTHTNTLTTTAVKILDLIYAYFAYKTVVTNKIKAKKKSASKAFLEKLLRIKLEATLIQIKFLLLSKNAENINSKYHSIYKEFFGKDSLLAQTLFNPAQEKNSADLFPRVNRLIVDSDNDNDNDNDSDSDSESESESDSDNESESESEKKAPQDYTGVSLLLSKDGRSITLRLDYTENKDNLHFHPIIEKYFPKAKDIFLQNKNRLRPNNSKLRLTNSAQQLALAYQLQQSKDSGSIAIKQIDRKARSFRESLIIVKPALTNITTDELIKKIHTAQKTKYLSFTDFVVKMTEILARHPKSQITQEKREVFEHFIAFYNRNLGNPDMMPRSVMIKKWAQAYKNEFNQENPFEVLAKQRGFFKSGLNQTASMELFKQFMAGEKNSEKLDALMSPFEKETSNLSGSLRSSSSSSLSS